MARRDGQGRPCDRQVLVYGSAEPIVDSLLGTSVEREALGINIKRAWDKQSDIPNVTDCWEIDNQVVVVGGVVDLGGERDKSGRLLVRR